MTPAAPSHRRWLQYRLRTLLAIVAVAAVLLAILAYHRDWLRQRKELVNHGGMAVGDGPNDAGIYEPVSPGLLKFVGENAYGYIVVFPERRDGQLTAAEFDRVALVRRVFPEARVDACWPDSAK